MTSSLVTAALLVPAVAFAAAEQTVPLPEGWIGTSAQWAQGLGIALALLNLIVLALAWRALQRRRSLQGALGILFLGLALLPIVLIFFGYTQGMSGMETVRACGGCHVMTAYVDDLHDPESEALSAIHYKNRYILENHCYTCHSNYGMLGTVSAKMDGVGHIYHLLTGTYSLPLKIAHPYPNTRCLRCHGESQKFLKSEGHPPDVQSQLMSGEVPCLTCHAPAHTPKTAKP